MVFAIIEIENLKRKDRKPNFYLKVTDIIKTAVKTINELLRLCLSADKVNRKP